MEVFYLSFDLAILTLVGIMVNFGVEYLQISYQVRLLTTLPVASHSSVHVYLTSQLFLLGLLNLFR